jgi:hypothetical protein
MAEVTQRELEQAELEAAAGTVLPEASPVEREEESAPPSPPEEPTTSTLDPKWMEAFEGLAYIGYLTGTLEIPFHKFVVRTLLSGEKLQVAQICREYEGATGYFRAQRAAIAGAGLLLADGRPILVADKTISVVQQKFDYVINTWFDPVIDLIYHKINALEGRAQELLKEMGIFNERRDAAVFPDGFDAG